MRHLYSIRMIAGLALLALVVWTTAPAAAETYAGANAESRVVLGVAVSPEAAGTWLPDGWAPLTLPRGPHGGANLIVILLDRQLQLDGSEAATDPASLRAMIFASFAVKQGEARPRLFVTRVYSTAPEFNPYGVARAAEITREMSLTDDGDGSATLSDRWRVAPAEGGAMSLDLHHVVGPHSWTAGESRIFSAIDPEVSRIYRYEQVDDVAMSRAMGKALQGEATLDWALPEFGAAFDGSEDLVAIVSRPHYLFRVFLP